MKEKEKVKEKIKHKINNIMRNISMKGKQCVILFKEFFKAFKDIFVIHEEDNTYVSLAPTSNADKDGTYCNAIKYAINNTEIKNIAISGNYGSGKSSVIKTFFSRLENKKYNPIYISLAAFNKNDYFNNIEKDDEKYKKVQNEFQHTLEKSILQQLFYQANEEDIPLSRFRRISKHSKIALNFLTVLVIFAITIIIFMISPNIIEKILNNYNYLVSKFPKIIIQVLLSFPFILIYFFIYKIIFLLTTKIKINKFKIKDAEVEINDKAESIFNRYLDEIIYFFQVMKHQIVIIEDLDRYDGEASFIFQKLRELNTLINSAKQVNYEVDFIYAIRDDYFKNYEERTKFFDYIIPIIPISSRGNSNEVIWERLENLKNNNIINYKFSKDFINDISLLIDDKRLVDNIINEFIIYKNKINKEHLDDKQLFAMLLYKNAYPESYSNLQKHDSKENIIKIFNNKEKKKGDLITLLNEEKENINLKKEKIKNEKLKDIKELKYILISSIYNYSYYGNEFFRINNGNMDIEKFISTVGLNSIINGNIIFNQGNKYLQENEVFRLFGSKENFIERWKVIEEEEEYNLKKLQKKLEEVDLKINTINNLTMEKLINQYGSDGIFDKDTKYIEKFLIVRGYITEEYRDYMDIFIPGDLTKDDNEFVSAARIGEILPYSYKLHNIENVLIKLDDNDFCKESVLNFDLLNYVINQNLTEQQLKIIHLLDKVNDKMLYFIDEFTQKYNPPKEFINLLIENSSNLWNNIYDRLGNKEYIDKWVIIYLLDSDSLKNINKNFTDYLINHEDIDKYIIDRDIEKVIESLDKLDIKFSNLQDIHNEKFIKEICNKQLYKLNAVMLKLLLKLYKIDIEEFDEKNLSLVLNSNDIIKKYVIENFDKYFNYCYVFNISNNDDEESILEIIRNEKIDLKIRKQIIKNEKFNKYNIKGIATDLINTIIEDDKLKVDYYNLISIFKQIGSLEINLINHISNHVMEYKENNIWELDNNIEKEEIILFINEYIFNINVSFEDFKTLAPTFGIKIENLKNIEVNKLNFLINNNLISFNFNNYEYINNNTIDSNNLVIFIINNINDFIENIADLDISEIKNELLLNENINKDYKIKIIENVNINDLDNYTVFSLIINEIISTDNISLNKKVLNDEAISIVEKNKMLLILLKSIEDERQETEYIHCLGEDYKDINTTKKLSKISKDRISRELCDELKRKNLISSYNDGRNNNYILYNKLKKKL